MRLTDYYRFEKIKPKAKTRLDCVASTGGYTELEEKRATKPTRESDTHDATNVGDLVIYFGDVPERFGGNVHRKADKSITIKGKNLSSVFVPDPESGFAYGDFKGTCDALLFVFKNLSVIDGRTQMGGIVEVFVARGMSKDRSALCCMLADGVLDDEMETLRKQANPEC